MLLVNLQVRHSVHNNNGSDEDVTSLFGYGEKVEHGLKDAFLTVDQVEKVLMQVPARVRQVMQAPPFWLLRKCLPGQRNAAMRWSYKF